MRELNTSTIKEVSGGSVSPWPGSMPKEGPYPDLGLPPAQRPRRYKWHSKWYQGYVATGF